MFVVDYTCRQSRGYVLSFQARAGAERLGIRPGRPKTRRLTAAKKSDGNRQIVVDYRRKTAKMLV
jgi:hypothetical protein